MSSLKSYLYIGLGLLVSGLLIAVKILAGRNSKLSTKLETADARIKHAKDVAQKKKENATEFSSRRAQAKAEIKESGVSDELSHPNDQ